MDPLWAPFGCCERGRTPGQDIPPPVSVKSVDTFPVRAREPVDARLIKLLKTQAIGSAITA